MSRACTTFKMCPERSHLSRTPLPLPASSPKSHNRPAPNSPAAQGMTSAPEATPETLPALLTQLGMRAEPRFQAKVPTAGPLTACPSVFLAVLSAPATLAPGPSSDVQATSPAKEPALPQHSIPGCRPHLPWFLGHRAPQPLRFSSAK